MLKSYLYSTQKRMLCAIADGNAKQKTREKTRANDFVVPSSYTYFPTSWMCDYIAEFFLSLNVLGVICTNDVFFFFSECSSHIKRKSFSLSRAFPGSCRGTRPINASSADATNHQNPFFYAQKRGDEKIESSLASFFALFVVKDDTES
jgi:hypothetical protein